MNCQRCGGNNDVVEFQKGTEQLVLCSECRLSVLAPGIRVSQNRWSNNACLGYAILGAQRLGYSQNQIKELVRAVYGEFDKTSLEEATVVYDLSPY